MDNEENNNQENEKVPSMVAVPPEALAPETLRRIIEAFVSREGTDYGEYEFSLDQKVEHVQKRLKSGRASIVFNAEDESFNIVEK